MVCYGEICGKQHKCCGENVIGFTFVLVRPSLNTVLCFVSVQNWFKVEEDDAPRRFLACGVHCGSLYSSFEAQSVGYCDVVCCVYAG
jgi:hypothetical protein